ncbi:prolyl 3-hydroxylase sudestada1 isoform X2 [Nilaparvata lugens]|uniref:prolyl 3-hydroxylase sudestada1 isoform X2 n=1 Tax=Nilaparvata lugens TaxID=108931 RepID=UPI00193D6330|nr:prolyl 3-hydroxylase sudestada1 isoform X2 [Nilaparvata lugens]
MNPNENHEVNYLSQWLSTLLRQITAIGSHEQRRIIVAKLAEIKNFGSLQVLSTDNPLRPLVISNLVSELKNLAAKEKATDLFTLKQSTDFCALNPKNYPMCTRLLEIFKQQIRKLVEFLFDTKLEGMVSMTASKFSYRDFLLTHDDQVEDRGVAFILYLEDWHKRNGGTLDFRSHDESGNADAVSFSIIPAKNRLTLFAVNELSHHQVNEVLGKDLPRLAISGWFHTGREHTVVPSRCPARMPALNPVLVNQPLCPLMFQSDYKYLARDVQFYLVHAEEIHKRIMEHRCMLLYPFLSAEWYEMIALELQSDEIEWKPVGSASRRHYETAQMTRRKIAGCPNTSKLLADLQGTSFLKLLSTFVMRKLDNAVKEDVTVSTEVMRISGGDYILVTDDKMPSKTSVDVWLFFATEHLEDTQGGDIGYSKPSENRGVMLCTRPKPKSAFIVPRDCKMRPCMEYVTKTVNKSHYVIKISFAVNFKDEDFLEKLTQPPGVICGDIEKFLAVEGLNEAIHYMEIDNNAEQPAAMENNAEQPAAMETSEEAAQQEGDNEEAAQQEGDNDEAAQQEGDNEEEGMEQAIDEDEANGNEDIEQENDGEEENDPKDDDNNDDEEKEEQNSDNNDDEEKEEQNSDNNDDEEKEEQNSDDDEEEDSDDDDDDSEDKEKDEGDSEDEDLPDPKRIRTE